jgi:hypothetical protein
MRHASLPTWTPDGRAPTIPGHSRSVAWTPHDLDNQINKGGVPMKRTIYLVALMLAMLAGNALAQDSKTPNVTVANRVISVSEEPIRLNAANVNSNGMWQITWVLADPKAYKFSENIGIDIKDPKPDNLDCNRIANGARYVCKFKPKKGTFNYKYDINVDPQDGSPRITLDPNINTTF